VDDDDTGNKKTTEELEREREHISSYPSTPTTYTRLDRTAETHAYSILVAYRDGEDSSPVDVYGGRPAGGAGERTVRVAGER
jgi:hypothetical protein